MEGPTDDVVAPESWEVADLEESVKRLLLKGVKSPTLSLSEESSLTQVCDLLPSSSGIDEKGENFPECAVNQLDEFLREAIQNPRERLSILRIERDMEKFIRDPIQQQLEFNQLPTSYLRLAAHRVAQHYSLQSMVLLDGSNSTDSSLSRIIVRKTPSSFCLPSVRLADIPLNPTSDEIDVIKVAIKQRPQKSSASFHGSSSKSSSENCMKTVEERKEDYNRARARIFNTAAACSMNTGIKTETQMRIPDGYQPMNAVPAKTEEKPIVDSADCMLRQSRMRPEKDSSSSSWRCRPGNNNRVAIFRDREVDRKDPDYDRSYERYMQRFDPGFGFNGGVGGGPYAIQPIYSPAVNYNTEFPQLGSSGGRRMECQPSGHAAMHGQWAASQSGYGHHPDAAIGHGHLGPSSSSTSPMYMHASQFASCHRPPAMPSFVYPLEHVQQSFSQKPETNFGLARPR